MMAGVVELTGGFVGRACSATLPAGPRYYGYRAGRLQDVSDRLFVSQSKLEAWIEKGEVTFVDNVLTLLAHGAVYRMAPAIRVTTVLDGADGAGLLDRVWTVAELEGRGAEVMYDSVLLGDTAYQGEPGFVGVEQQRPAQAAPAGEGPPPLPPARPKTESPAATIPAVAPPAAAPAAAGTKPATDMDLLTEFLLKNM